MVPNANVSAFFDFALTRVPTASSSLPLAAAVDCEDAAGFDMAAMIRSTPGPSLNLTLWVENLDRVIIRPLGVIVRCDSTVDIRKLFICV